MQHPNTVKVDQQVQGASLLEVGLEEGPAPVDLVELHEPLGGRNIHQAGLRIGELC